MRVLLILTILFQFHLISQNKPPALDLLVRTLADVEDPVIQENLLKGMIKGLSGIKEIIKPAEWNAVNEKLLKSSNSNVRKLAGQMSQKFGDYKAFQAALDTLINQKAPIEDRKQSLRSLAADKHKNLLPLLQSLLKQPLIEQDAIRAYSSYSASNIPSILLTHFEKAGPQIRRSIIETLSTRQSFAEELVNAISSKKVSRKEVPAYIARSLKNLLGSRFTKVYGEIQEVSQNKSKLIAKYKSKLNSKALQKASASHGRAIFQATCAACHKMYESGGNIGPDLTGSNRADRDYILLNIIDPSFDVPEGYRMVTVTRKGGQVLVGSIAQEDNQKVVLKMVGSEVVIPKSEIVARKISKVSMMPEGLLNNLSDKDFFNLIKYLQTDKQVELPK